MLVHQLRLNECLETDNGTMYFQIVDGRIVIGIEGNIRVKFKKSQHKINFKNFVKNLSEKEVEST